MFGSLKTKAFWLFIALVSFVGSTAIGVSAQNTKPPLMQPIVVQPTSTPLVKKTGSVTPVAPNADTLNPMDSEITIPGYTGILVEDQNGKIIRENYSDYTFNPASNVKIATAYAVLKTFGPDFRFPTQRL